MIFKTICKKKEKGEKNCCLFFKILVYKVHWSVNMSAAWSILHRILITEMWVKYFRDTKI